jgi:hypothetical protein
MSATGFAADIQRIELCGKELIAAIEIAAAQARATAHAADTHLLSTEDHRELLSLLREALGGWRLAMDYTLPKQAVAEERKRLEELEKLAVEAEV